MTAAFDTASIYIIVERSILPQLVDYCRAIGDRPLVLVADRNTYPAFGAAVEAALAEAGLSVQSIVMEGGEVIADERAVAFLLAKAGEGPATYLAVGSGTITDITRYASHQTHNVFISVPTAPSVDGFTSVIAAMVFHGMKTSIETQPPVAVFADLDALCSAPQTMIAAGFGDMAGKYTSLADWKLGHLLWDEPYDEAIAERVHAALASCAEMAREIGRASENGVRRVMGGLIESGLCMVEYGRSTPASGGEHHISHYLEMKLLREGRPAILHGAKVGLGTVHAARRYESVSRMSRAQLMARLEELALPDRDAEIERIRAGFGPASDQVIETQRRFLDLDEIGFGLLKSSIVEHWDDIQAIARLVPPSKAIADLIRAAGGASDHHKLGLSDEDLSLALTYAHYVRPSFTINRLSWLLGVA